MPSLSRFVRFRSRATKEHIGWDTTSEMAPQPLAVRTCVSTKSSVFTVLFIIKALLRIVMQLSLWPLAPTIKRRVCIFIEGFSSNSAIARHVASDKVVPSSQSQTTSRKQYLPCSDFMIIDICSSVYLLQERLILSNLLFMNSARDDASELNICDMSIPKILIQRRRIWKIPSSQSP